MLYFAQRSAFCSVCLPPWGKAFILSAFRTSHRPRIFSPTGAYSGSMAAKRGGGRIKTVVYLDVLLLTNFLTAYLLLLAAGALSGQRAPFARDAGGAAHWRRSRH